MKGYSPNQILRQISFIHFRYTQIGVNFGTYNGRCDDSERSESAGVRVSGVIEWIRQHAAGTFDSKCNKF